MSWSFRHMVAECGGGWQSVAECSLAAVKAGLGCTNELDNTQSHQHGWTPTARDPRCISRASTSAPRHASHAADLSLGRLRTAASISSRRKIQRRPSLRPGSSPRRAYSSTVEIGRCSNSATSRPSRTSSRVSRGRIGVDVEVVLIDLGREAGFCVIDPEPPKTANEFANARSRLNGTRPLDARRRRRPVHRQPGRSPVGTPPDP